MDRPEVVVGIPTYRRPNSLRRLLDSIAAQRVEFTPVVVVADNDCDGNAGVAVAKELAAQGFPFEIRALPVPERGLSAVRNAIMECAFDQLGADLVAMVDDDERVEPLWLSSLVAMRRRTSADVVFGAILAEFESEPPSWVRGQSIYWGNPYRAGISAFVPGSGNILISRRVHDGLRAKFDDRFSLSGGEDKEFFERIGLLGARFAHAPDAVSHEFVGASRMTRRWAMQRAFRIGCTDTRVLKLYANSPWAPFKAMMTAVAGLATGVTLLSVCWLSPRLQMKGGLLVSRQVGKAYGALGKAPNMYAVTHGD